MEERAPSPEAASDEMANGVQRQRTRLALAIRLTLYGLPALAAIFLLYDMIRPLPVPTAVLRVDGSSAGKDADLHPIRLNAGSVMSSQTEDTDAPSSRDLEVVVSSSLFPEDSVVPQGIRPECTGWNDRFERILGDLSLYETQCGDLPYADARLRLQSLFGDLWVLAKDIDITAHQWATRFPSDSHTEWDLFVAPTWERLTEVWNALAQKHLECFVRSKRWRAAAHFSDVYSHWYSHDADETLYYWRQVGGKEGHIQGAMVSLGRAWDGIRRVVSLRLPPSRRIAQLLYPVVLAEDEKSLPSPILPPTPPERSLPYGANPE